MGKTGPGGRPSRDHLREGFLAGLADGAGQSSRIMLNASATFIPATLPRKRASASIASIDRAGIFSSSCDWYRRIAQSLSSSVCEMSTYQLGSNGGSIPGATQWVSETVS